jgi:hypothetical protein
VLRRRRSPTRKARHAIWPIPQRFTDGYPFGGASQQPDRHLVENAANLSPMQLPPALAAAGVDRTAEILELADA